MIFNVFIYLNRNLLDVLVIVQIIELLGIEYLFFRGNAINRVLFNVDDIFIKQVTDILAFFLKLQSLNLVKRGLIGSEVYE